MDIVDFCDFCDTLPCAEQTMPFDDTTVVYKVGGRMFAMIDIDNPDHFAVKCDPDRAVMLREIYDSVRGAYHLNKRYWNDIFFNTMMSDSELKAEIIHSYLLVISQNVTPKALKNEIMRYVEEAGIEDKIRRFE